MKMRTTNLQKKRKQRSRSLLLMQNKAINELLSSRALTPADFAEVAKNCARKQVWEKILGHTQHNEEERGGLYYLGWKVKYKQLREEEELLMREKEEKTEKFGSKGENERCCTSTTNKEKSQRRRISL